MKFSDEQISTLALRIKERLSEKRFVHTLGVLHAAEKIGEYFPDIDVSELSCAALLHDVSKEESFEEQLALLNEADFLLSESDKKSPLILHALSAPFVVLREFSEYATANVLSAVQNHTTGAPDMSVFDEIVMISDYVEAGRSYDGCVSVRNELFDDLKKSKNELECESALHKAVYKCLVNTEKDVLKRGRFLNERSIVTKDHFATLTNNKC